MVVKACNYITGNAPVQLLCPKTRWSRGHYGILIFILISVLDQLQADTCPSMGQFHFMRAPMTCDLRVDLPVHRLRRGFAVELGRHCLQNERRYMPWWYW
jgi:hypothetical protein